MSDLTVSQLAALDGKEYAAQIKTRLRDDAAWAIMVSPMLVGRTQLALARIVQSIDVQKERYVTSGTAEPHWLDRIESLRRMIAMRLEPLGQEVAPPKPSANKETRAWRSFSARLAAVLEEDGHPALDELKTPYGGLTAREWLAAREQKAGAS